MPTIPPFLGPKTTVTLDAAAGPAGPTGGAARADRLDFAIQEQEKRLWCWAAVSTSVVHYFDADSRWTQCLVANAALGREDCCGTGPSEFDECNRVWTLDTALVVTGCFHRMIWSPVGLEQIQRQIAKKSPIGCRVAWDAYGAHFMVIFGWLVAENGITYIEIDDPIFLHTQIPLDEFARYYELGGDWTHTYLTSPPPAGAPAGGSQVASLDAGAVGA